ncbi:MAG: hypothetical protein ACRYFU_15125 [Janthinobacterium lividum]
MTQQPYETVEPPAATVYSRPVRVIALMFLAIFTVGIGNVIYSVRHQTRPVTVSALALLQQRDSINAQLARMYPAQPQTPVPDPDDFVETRDGSNALIPEDENDKASIWKDTKSGSRIFCLDSCIVLPASHRHHREGVTSPKGKDGHPA